MTETVGVVDALDARVRRRGERREFFKAVVGSAAIGMGAFAFASPAAAQTVTDNDVLNFALNLEYLEAQFYLYAANGTGLAANQQTGTGTQGGVDLTTTAPPRAVNFTGDPIIGQYAREIAADEAAHVAFLRTALGSAAVSQPRLSIGGGLNADGTPTAFTAAARAAGVVGATGTFDPYSSPNNFLLAAFIFEDVGVTAYKGASPLITNKAFLEAAAGILAVEAYHAAIVRTVLYGRGVATPALRTSADQISNARDSLDGTSDLDQGISPLPGTGGNQSNIVPLDGNGIAFSRTTGQVLNIVYLNRNAVTLGGFFPAGVNGTIRTSAAN
jgi:hypothetical protein